MAADAWRNSRWPTHVGLVAVAFLFCAPLFVGLSGWDLGNDEAIHSYAVDRILETGDWLTPRTVPYDGPFLEKPPLKFWMVAAAIDAGLLPHDEFGLRFIDALFGSIVFVYVFFLGRWLAGPICGVVAVLVLFTLDPLIFEHGLRSNNMEAALVLAYCGGVYHFAQWIENGSTKRGRIHALVVATYFTLGFMTKFVAVLFLPLVCAVAIAWRPDFLRRLRSDWRDWVVPLLFVVAATGPWFAYQVVLVGPALWETMFEMHVVERFTVALDPRHLRPWNFYYSQLWLELILAGSHWIGVFGAAMLVGKAWKGDPWLARLLFVWWMLPIAVISFGASKVFHYSYPFLPPLALGAGAVVQALFSAVERRASAGFGAAGRAIRRTLEGSTSLARANTFARRLVVIRRSVSRIAPIPFAAALFAVAVAAWTAIDGPLRWEVHGVRLLRNSTVSRPLLIGAILLYLSGYIRVRYVHLALSRTVALGVVAILLPLVAYSEKIDRTMSVRHPLRTLRDCTLSFSSSLPPETHVYMPYGELQSHVYYYYLRRPGPWVQHERPRVEALRGQLSGNRLMLLTKVDYTALDREVGAPFALALTDRAWVIIAATGGLERCVAAAAATGAVQIRPLRRTGL